jgi:hypothetical protein
LAMQRILALRGRRAAGVIIVIHVVVRVVVHDRRHGGTGGANRKKAWWSHVPRSAKLEYGQLLADQRLDTEEGVPVMAMVGGAEPRVQWAERAEIRGARLSWPRVKVTDSGSAQVRYGWIDDGRCSKKNREWHAKPGRSVLLLRCRQPKEASKAKRSNRTTTESGWDDRELVVGREVV